MPDVMLIAGCARSGTTALRGLLMRDDRLAIGLERYLTLAIRDQLTAELWTRERFLDVRQDDSHVREGSRVWPMAQEPLSRARDRWDELAYVGDKLPRLSLGYASLAATAPEAKIIYLLREPGGVAASYNARARNPHDAWRPEADYQEAVRHWNADVAATVAHLGRLNFLIVRYEALFSEMAQFERLYDFLGLRMKTSIRATWERGRDRQGELAGRRVSLTDEERAHIAAHADHDSYRALSAQA